jgi:phosphoglucosamine mutase
LLQRQQDLLAIGRPLAGRLVAKIHAGRIDRPVRRCAAACQRGAALAAVQRVPTSLACTMWPPTVDALKVWAAAGLPAGHHPSRDSTHTMTRQYFGTDGIRGTVGQAPITPDFMLRLGHAVGRVLRRNIKRPTVLIGKDTRISGYMMESRWRPAWCLGRRRCAVDRPLPTPGVAYLTRALRLSLGVVISASHNAYPDNGIKFFSAKGEKAARRLGEGRRGGARGNAAVGGFGLARQGQPPAKMPTAATSSSASPPSTRTVAAGLKVVVDAAHGAAYQVAPDVFHELGAEVVAIGCAPDGTNINDGVGATAPEALVAAVAEHGADYGVALDGDADRLQLVDAQRPALQRRRVAVRAMVADRLAQGERCRARSAR